MEEERDARASVNAESRPRETEFVIRVPNLFGWLRDQVPDEFVTHMRAAQREQLLAMRSLIDAAIERTERADATQRGRRRVEIEVD